MSTEQYKKPLSEFCDQSPEIQARLCQIDLRTDFGIITAYQVLGELFSNIGEKIQTGKKLEDAEKKAIFNF